MNKNKKSAERDLMPFLRKGDVEGFFGELREIIKDLQKEIPALDFNDFVVKYKRDSQDAVNTAITAKGEEKAKDWICPRLPEWVSPDILTVLGYVGMIMTGLGFIFGFANKWFILLIPFGLFVNWFGDSFDGSIARYRKKTRPNYGYFIDKIVDAIAVITLALGIGLSGFVKIEIALLFACAYLALMIYVDLVVYVEGKAKNSFGLFGPTEIRIIGALFSIYMFFSKVRYFDIWGHSLTQYDLGTLVLTVVMFGILAVSIIKKGIELHKIDIAKWK